MRTVLAAVLLALLASAASAAEPRALPPGEAPDAKARTDRIDLRILYCGNPGSPREADFRALLERHFTHVATADYETFTPAQADGHDVVIFDWTYGYDGNGGVDRQKWELKAPAIPENFTRPSILIGRAGGKIGKALKLKIDWLCLCLEGPAHHVKLDHPIFHGPLSVEPALEEVPTPGDYSYMTLDPAGLGERMTAWRVQSKEYPAIDPGLVSTLYGFEDSPDAEVIARGMAGKGPDTVALARQANYLLWGFSAPPADMTPSGRRAFVNAVAYIRRFDGACPLVRATSRAREWALRYAMMPRYLSDDYRRIATESKRDAFRKHPDWIPEPKRASGIDAFVAEQVEQELKSNADVMTLFLPEDLRRRFGDDAAKYLAYYRENLEYLRPAGGESMMLVVDEDVKALGTPNRSVELLDRCVTMLERHDRPDLALRLLKRYTDQSFDAAPDWRGWLAAHRARLFFSDIGGYRFFEARETPGAAAEGDGILRPEQAVGKPRS